MNQRVTIFEEATGYTSWADMFTNLFNIKTTLLAGVITALWTLIKELIEGTILDQGIFIAILAIVTVINWCLALLASWNDGSFDQIKIRRAAIKLIFEIALILVASLLFTAVGNEINLSMTWGPLFVSLTFILQHIHKSLKNAHRLELITDEQLKKLNSIFEITSRIKGLRNKGK